MKNKFKHIANVIKSNRINNTNLSQQELSRIMGYRNGQFVSNIERGLCSLPMKWIVMAARNLKIDPRLIQDAMMKDLEVEINEFIEREVRYDSITATK